MKVEIFVTHTLSVNCYLLYTDSQVVIVDPAEELPQAVEFIAQRNLEVVGMIDTHGHADHIAGNSWFLKQFDAPLMIHEADEPYLHDFDLNLARYIRRDFPDVTADRLLSEGDTVVMDDEVLKVLHTPGHTPGSICLYTPGILISGDTLFQGSVGRTDLPGGDGTALRESVIRLGRLPLDTIVYPGHGEATTIRDEVINNPFL